MINFSNIILEKMAIHKVGNKSKAEKNFFSEVLYKPSASNEDKLLKYFLSSFKKLEETYQFNAPENDTNTMFNLSKSFFATKENFLECSQRISRHLYDQSKHQNIKSGEVFVVHFTELLYGEEMVEAIGIFKCERKSEFMQVNEIDSELLLNFQNGINIGKMDKGVLLMNVEQEDGFRVLSIDNNYYDTSYWLLDFLDVVHVQDDFFHTSNYLEMVDNFTKEILAPKMDKAEQIEFMNDSVDYFAKHETFNFDEFVSEVASEPEVVAELKNYRNDFALNDVEAFSIAPAAINNAKRKIKNNIKLDNGVSIKMNFTNPDESKGLVERGFDEDKGMYFYKVFFNEEME
jgi:hypothetical protein